MKEIRLKNKHGEVYNIQKLKDSDVDAFLSKEFHPHKDSENLSCEILEIKSSDEIEISKKAQRNSIRAIKNANNVAQLKAAMIELIKYLDIGEEEE